MNQLLPPIVLVILVSYLFTATESRAAASNDSIEVAHQALVNCQKSQVQIIDDSQSDVRVIALKLTNACLSQYQNLSKVTAKKKYDNSNERRMFRIEQNAKVLKIDASLAVVRMNRRMKP
jgi:hypothetical protein